MKRNVLFAALLLAAVALGGGAWKISLDGRDWLARARDAEIQDPLHATLWYGEAMRAYVPLFHPHVKEAHAALVEMARRAEAHDNLRGALDGWREIHASLRAVRSFHQPYPAWLDESAGEIARLEAAVKAASAPPPSDAAEETAP